MDLLVKIEQSYNSKPQTWKRIADYVSRHPKEIAGMKVSELQKVLSVSSGSIINFVQSLGCSGYSEFKVLLAQSDGGFNRKNFSSNTNIAQRIATELQSITVGLDADVLDALAQRIATHKRVYLTGIHTSAYVAGILSGYFVRLGVMSCVLGEDRTRASALLGKDDTLLAISYSGGTDAVNDAVRNAKAAGATTACMTSFPESNLAKLCDFVLCVETFEAQNGEFPLISRICQLTVAEMLLSEITKKLKTEGLK